MSPAEQTTTTTPSSSSHRRRPLTIGVFGGSFNPIHTGHALLAITTQQTMPVDSVVLVPVYKHAIKRDLLPFEDRVAMCELAIRPFRGGGGGVDNDDNDDESNSSSNNSRGVQVSTVERDVKESNGAMLRALKKRYPEGSKFLWICGDDFFRWMERPKGLETLGEVSGLIVQRRLHKAATGNDDDDRFFKEPMDEARVRSVAARLNLTIDFICGELPHFSSTLVRRAPGHWRSFLPQAVTKYLDARPHLLAQLHANLEADAKKEEQEKQNKGNAAKQAASTSMDPPQKKQKVATTGRNDAAVSVHQTNTTTDLAASLVVRGLEAVHALQIERGRTGLWLSMGTTDEVMEKELREAQANTDAMLGELGDVATRPHDDDDDDDNSLSFKLEEVHGLALELGQISVWLGRDRHVLSKQQSLQQIGGVEGWTRRWALVAKFNPRIDVLIGASVRALTEILDEASSSSSSAGVSDSSTEATKSSDLSELLLKWLEGKEALGRLRAFVCAGGPTAPATLKKSLPMRQRVLQAIETKERSIARVWSLQEGMSSDIRVMGATDALHRMLEQVILCEWSLMGSFAPSTPLALVHKLLASRQGLLSSGSLSTGSSSDGNGLVNPALAFDVESFFEASSAAIDLMQNFAKALAASACARA